MILIGEKLNSSIPSAGALMKQEDMAALQDLAYRQAESGADYLDVNTAMLADETGFMLELLPLLADTGAGICIDSPDPATVRAALAVCNGVPTLVNSTDDQRLPDILEALADSGASIVLMPRLNDKKGSLKEAARMLQEAGIPREKIFADVVVEALAVNTEAATNVLSLMAYAKEELGLKTLAGLSNISFGLPARPALNRAFMALLAFHGLDAAICNVLDESIRGAAAAGFALSGEDAFCMEYLEKMR